MSETVDVREVDAGHDGLGPDEPMITRRPGRAEADPVGFAKRRRRIDNLLRFGVPILILCCWQITSANELINRRYFPAPTDIWSAMVDAIDSGVLQEALRSTAKRLFSGYFLGALVGIVFGFLLGLVRPLRIALEPVISALYTVPKLAILPLLLLIFGIGDTPKIILIALGVFFVTSISTISALSDIPKAYREPAQSFGAGRMAMFRHVMLPFALPEIFTALRLSAGISVLITIGIEFVQGSEGIGWLIWNSWQLFLSDRMYVGIVTIAVLGVAFQSAVKWAGRLLTPWVKAQGQRDD